MFKRSIAASSLAAAAALAACAAETDTTPDIRAPAAAACGLGQFVPVRLTGD